MKRFAILGHPVSHSLSPKLHNAVFQAMGLSDHVYEFYDCPPEKLKDAIQEMREGKWEGFSVTIPHKQEVMKFLDEIDDAARRIGAVNTVIRQRSGKLVGMNTDYPGFSIALEVGMLPRHEPPRTALVLGSGGAALAVIAVLRDLGCKVIVASRSGKEGTVSYDALNADDDYKLIVNTTPVGMGDGKLLLADDRWYRLDRVYFDVVYTPIFTPFLQRAINGGAKVITGDRMFLWQAVEQAKIFTGRDDVPVQLLEGLL